MRIRRTVAQEWELLNKRSYLYAGAGKGAPIATWKQAARANSEIVGVAMAILNDNLRF